MQSKIRIGSRDSALAQWQAKEVQSLLQNLGYETEIIWIKSQGDMVQDKPLHTLGTVGVFTKALDDALLADRIDIAVHSCKDLPSRLHPELTTLAYLEREDARDVLVSNHQIDFLDDLDFSGTIATGSVRRKAQILARFPKANVVGLRGNVPTRLEKLKNSDWQGAVFAYAGLKRLGTEPKYYAFLDFMVPAPAQGVVAVVGKNNNSELAEACEAINHVDTQQTTVIERDFLRLMEGGCISPIGARALLNENENLQLAISILSPNGQTHIEFTQESKGQSDVDQLATITYEKAKSLGAVTLIEQIERNA